MTVTRTTTGARYRIVHSALSGGFKIADEQMNGAYCALPDENGILRQLTFRTGERARGWLQEMQRRQEGAQDADA